MFQAQQTNKHLTRLFKSKADKNTEITTKSLQKIQTSKAEQDTSVNLTICIQWRTSLKNMANLTQDQTKNPNSQVPAIGT